MMRKGLTLAELLIALAILGVIATFTIPKVLQAQQNEQSKSIAKEAAGTLSAAFHLYKLNSQIVNGTSLDDLTPYLNYVKHETGNVMVNHRPGVVDHNCSWATVSCYKLHNGAMLWWIEDWDTFPGSESYHAVTFAVDPDGKALETDASKAVNFVLKTNGRITTLETSDADSLSVGGALDAVAGADPPWFSWD